MLLNKILKTHSALKSNEFPADEAKFARASSLAVKKADQIFIHIDVG